jgi:hypothetical protein
MVVLSVLLLTCKCLQGVVVLSLEPSCSVQQTGHKVYGRERLQHQVESSWSEDIHRHKVIEAQTKADTWMYMVLPCKLTTPSSPFAKEKRYEILMCWW